MEFLFETDTKLIHFRSAARSGYYDFNVNHKKRTEQNPAAHGARMTPRTVPLVSVIIPVLREAHQLDTLIDHLILIADGLPVELIVVDGSPDREMLKAISREGVRLLTAPAGRALQMTWGRPRSGNFLLFLHADTRLPRGAFRRIAETLSDGRHVLPGRGLDATGYAAVDTTDGPGAACVLSRLTRIPYGDRGAVLPADYFELIGGFSDIPLMEDVGI